MGLFNKNKDGTKKSEKGFSLGKDKKDKIENGDASQEASELKDSAKPKKSGLLSGLKKDKKSKDVGLNPTDESKDSVVSIGVPPKGKIKGKKNSSQLKLLLMSFVVLILIASTAYFVLPVLLGNNQGTIQTDSVPNTATAPVDNTSINTEPQPNTEVNDSTENTNSGTEPSNNTQIAEENPVDNTTTDNTQTVNSPQTVDNTQEANNAEKPESQAETAPATTSNASDNATSEQKEHLMTKEEPSENTNDTKDSNFNDLANIKIYREE